MAWEARDCKLGREMVLLFCSFEATHRVRGMNWLAVRAEGQEAEKILRCEISPKHTGSPGLDSENPSKELAMGTPTCKLLWRREQSLGLLVYQPWLIGEPSQVSKIKVNGS